MRRWRSYEEAHAELEALDPSQRVPVLLAEFQNEALSLPTEEVRRLFVFAWDDAATPADLDHDVVRMLRWIMPVRDEERYLNGTLTVYRPADGNEYSIRWTLDEERATAASTDGIIRANVAASDVLAHFTAGGNDQLLVDPNELSAVELVSRAG
jgi:hypothetical protein